MNFRPDSIALIEQGVKTMTRRPCGHHQHSAGYSDDDPRAGQISAVHDECEHLEHVCRVKWKVGRTYAICPGRGKKTVGRILLTGIKCERVDAITEEDVKAEGLRDVEGLWWYGERFLGLTNYYDPEMGLSPAEAYKYLWRSMYPKSDCTELCWALTFRRER